MKFMTDYNFRPASRENVGLLIAFAGPSGGGKTLSAMRMAAGIVGPGNKFAVIDTEARRALHYADKFKFDHLDMRPPFRPEAFAGAIKAADEQGYKAIITDSMSLEWVGEGGVLDWQEDELQRMAGDDWQKREAVKMASWIKPKMAHKDMMNVFLQTRAHLIFCLRAEEKMQMVKNDRGKTVPVSIGFQPICEKAFMFEATCSFMLLPEHPGFGQPIKLQEQHKAAFPPDEPIDEETGRRLAAWAAGGSSGGKAAVWGPEQWTSWGGKAVAAVSGCKTLAALDKIEAENVRPRLAGYQEAMPEKAQQLIELMGTTRGELSAPPSNQEG